MTDAANELLDELIERLKTATVPALAALPVAALPVSVDLWDIERIAAYLKRSIKVVRDEVVQLPGFPRPIRIPTSKRPHPLYKAREVVKWAESHQAEKTAS